MTSFRAHFTPKPGHIALSPCLVGCWVVGINAAGVITSLEMGDTETRCGAEGCCTDASTQFLEVPGLALFLIDQIIQAGQ